MFEIDAFKFCPQCGDALTKQDSRLLRCTRCTQHLYINPKPTNGLIIDDNNKILLVKRKIEPKEGWWDVPGGFVEPLETMEESSMREAREELGVGIKNLRYIGSYADTYRFQNITYYTIAFMFTAQLNNFHLTPADDVAEVKWFAHNNVLKQKIAFEAVRHGLEDYLAKQ